VTLGRWPRGDCQGKSQKPPAKGENTYTKGGKGKGKPGNGKIGKKTVGGSEQKEFRALPEPLGSAKYLN